MKKTLEELKAEARMQLEAQRQEGEQKETLISALSAQLAEVRRTRCDRAMLARCVAGPCITRYDLEPAGLSMPSLSFEPPELRETDWATGNDLSVGEAFAPPIVRADFVDGTQSTTVSFPPNTSFYGTGEVAGKLLRNGCTVECWNTDAYGYDEHTKALYQTLPWVLAVLENGWCCGVLADTTARTTIGLTLDSIEVQARAQHPVLIFGPWESPALVLKSLTSVVGRMPLLPGWALGYHQCRFSYMSSAEVLELVAQFR